VGAAVRCAECGNTVQSKLHGKGPVPALDGLRGIAILLVLVYHYLGNLGVAMPVFRQLLGVLHSGWIGVDLFFVLSGFLITGILFDARQTAHYFRNYYARRTLRIFPLYYGVLAVLFLVVPLFSNYFDHPRAVQGYFWLYATNVYVGTHPDIHAVTGWTSLAHLWSLAMEEQFYLVWPFVIWVCSRRQAIGVCAVVIAAAIASRCFMTATGYAPESIYFLPWCRMDALAIGGLVALLARGPRGMEALVQPAKYAVVPCTVILAVMFFQEDVLNNVAPAMQTVGYTILAFFFAAVLVFTVQARHGSQLQRILTTSVLRTLGKYSYGMYVFHMLLYPALVMLFHDPIRGIVHSTRLSEVVFAAVSITVIFAVAWASWHLFEKHFLKLKRHFEYQPVEAEPIVAVPRRTIKEPELVGAGS
jgi:peptidoglycan/LPS O-acetylase OafA/YrhL